MRRLLLALVALFSILSISCEIGLGASVDTDPPSLSIKNPPVDAVIRDDFAISGTWSDDGTIASVSVELSRTDGKGETLKYAGTFVKTPKKIGEGTWTAEIPAKTKLITDGTYQAVVTIKDATDRKTTQSTTFTLDNTAPIIIVQRPASDVSVSDENSVDTFGKIMTLEGRAADDNNIDHIDVKIYSDAAKTKLIHTVNLKNVPLSIALDVAKWGDDAYNKIYGTTVGDKQRYYCSIEAYDSAQRYPADGSEQSEEDKNGNCATDFYLYNEIASSPLADIKVTDLYSVMNGTNSRAAVDSNVVITTLNQLKKSTGTFFLNPQNNPTFKLASWKSRTFNTDGSVDDYGFIAFDGTSISFDVEPGLDNYPLNRDSIRVYLIEAEYDGKNPKVKSGASKMYLSDDATNGVVKISGASTYKVAVTIDRTKAVYNADGVELTEKLKNGCDYIAVIEGKDSKENELFPEADFHGIEGYPIRIASATGAPEVSVSYKLNDTVNTDSIIYMPKYKNGEDGEESKLTLSGTVKVSTSDPGDKPNDFYVLIDGTKKTGIDADALTRADTDPEGEYKFENIEIGFTGGSKTHSVVVVADNGSKAQESKSIWYDAEGPQIEIRNVNPEAYEYEENGTASSTKYLNGDISITVSVMDDSSGVEMDTSKSEKMPKIEFIQGETKTPVTADGEIVEIPFTKSVSTSGLNNDAPVTILVTAYDKAGNKSKKRVTYEVKQDTDKPYVVVSENPAKRTISNTYADITSTTIPAEDKKNVFKSGDTLRFKFIDDDELKRYTLYTKRIANASETASLIKTSAGVTSKTEPIDSGKEYNFTYTLPSTQGIYAMWIDVEDVNGKIRSIPERTDKSPFYVKVAPAAPVITLSNETWVTTNTTDVTATVKDKVLVNIKIDSSEESVTVKRKGYKPSEAEPSTPPEGDEGYIRDSSENPIKTVSIPVNTSSAEVTDYFKPEETESGTYNIKYFVSDGNSSAQQAVTYKIDNNKPVADISSSKPTEYASTNTFKGSVTENDSGVKEVQVSFKADHSDAVTASGTKEWYYDAYFGEGTAENPGLNLSEGTNKFYVRAIDNVGNIGIWAEQEFVYDKAAPQIEIKLDDVSLDTTLTQIKTAEYTFKYKASDSYGLKAPATVTLKKNDESFTDFTETTGADGWKTVAINRANPTDSIDGIYTYTISATDKANKQTIIERTVKLDTAAPVITITTPSFDLYQDTETINVRGAAEDDSGILAVWYKLTDENESAPLVPDSAVKDIKADASWTANGWVKANGLSNWNIQNLAGAEGTVKKLYITAVDKNGVTHAQSDIIKEDFRVDLYNPTFTEESIKAGTAYEKTSYTFSGKASDTGAAIKSIVIKHGTKTYAWYKDSSLGTTTSDFEYNSSTGAWSYTVPVTSSTAEGTYDYTLTATDGANKPTVLNRTVVYDKTKPEIADITSGSWYKTRTITITPEITENGSGIDSVKATTDAADAATRTWVDIPLSSGIYKGPVEFDSDGKNKKIYIIAKDKANNESDEKEVLVNIDTTDPDLDKLKYQVGSTSLKDISGTVYINASNGITVYGSYSDSDSGVGILTFEGTKKGSDNKCIQPVITYSTAASIPTGKTVADLTYGAYAAGNAAAITYWKAVFDKDILETAKLSVTGSNIAGGSKTINLFTVDKDTVPPTFKNEKIEPDTDDYSVYKTKEGSGDSAKTVYYLNHEKQKFNISGLASDANTAVDQVYIKIYKIGANGNADANPSIEDNNATGYFSNIQFADYVKDSQGNITATNFWSYGAKVTITVTDIAGNSTADNSSQTIMNIKFDTEGPSSVHKLDATGKDLAFRIGDAANNDITSENASSVYGLTWNEYTESSTTYKKIDEAAGGKYMGGTFGNSYTQKVRGKFIDSGSGLKQVFYKIYDRSESKIFDASTGEEKYNLTDSEKQTLIKDVISANQYFAPLTTPEYKRVFYNVPVDESDPYGGKQLKKNGTAVKETKSVAGVNVECYKYWKLEDATYSFTIPQLNEGSNYLVIVAEDNVGNYYLDTSDPIDHDGNPSTSARRYSNFSMNVDTTAPTIDLIGSTDIQYSDGGDFEIEVKAQDLGVADSSSPTGYVPNTSSGIKKVELSTDVGSVTCALKTGTTDVYVGNVKSILQNNKTLTVSATAYDVAGSSSKKVVANVMVDETAPTVTLNAPTDADRSAAAPGTQVNGTITISGTADDPNGSGLKEAVDLYYKVVSVNANAPAKPADNADTTANTWDWTAVTGVTPSGTSPWSFANVNTKSIPDGSRVYFTAAVKDNAGNVGYAAPKEVFIDQDSDRPVIKITSMSLSNMAADTRAGSKEPELTGSVSDDDEVPNALAYRIGDSGAYIDSEDSGSSLIYSASDGQFTLTLDDGPQNVYFKVTTNEKDENNQLVTFETKLDPDPADADEIQTMPKLTDRGGVKYGYKDSTKKATVIYLAVDTEAPETEEFAFIRTPSNEASWSSAISGEFFGGSQKQTFYLREYAYDANEVKQVYLSLPASEADGLSSAITAWSFKDEQTRVTKTIYTIGNQPATGANYWLISTASGTKAGTLSDASADHKTVTITGGDNAGTYTRSAYIFQLAGPGTQKTGKAHYYLWQSANDNPVDVTNLASGERNATLVTFDGTRQTTETKIIKVDNTAPTINISAPSSVTSTAVVNGSIVGESERTTVSFAVTKTDVTDGSTITSWTEEEKAGTSSFKVNFDSGDEEDAFETHTSLLKQYLITLGILTQNDIDTKSDKARQLQPVHVWIKSEDICNNKAYNHALVYVDALGNIPTVTIGYPTSDGQTLGGSVSIMGTAKDNVDPKFVWLQFDITGENKDSPSYVPEWTLDDFNLIKDEDGYQFGNMKTNEDIAVTAVTAANIGYVGIKVPVEGGSWSQIINTLKLFPNTSVTANDVTMWAYATDDDNGDGTVINVSRAETKTFSVDKDNPYFVHDSLKLVQYETETDPDSTKKRELVYKEGMYIRGIWWLEGEVKDESSGINIVKKNDYGDNNQYGEYSDNLVSQTTGDIRFTPKQEGNNTNYTFKIKVGDASESGRNRFKIKAWENKTTDTRDDEKEFIIYYDNKAPTFNTPSDSSDGIAKEVKNSDGFYGLHSTAYEANTNDSGVEFVAVYFTRTIGTDTYIFDPMYKRGFEINNKNVSKMKIDNSLAQDTGTNGDKLYWGTATASTLSGVKVELTAEVASYVHVGGLAKIDGFVYRILDISSDKKTVTLSGAPHNLTSDKKVFFAVANVVDNTKEEKKTANATSGRTTDYGYGYPVFADNVDDGDGIMEYLKNIDSITWNWNLYINSKNIPDGDIKIHYVIFDKAGNSAYGSVEDASVENNQPRLVSVKIGRDVNQDGSIATTNPETIIYYKNGSTGEEDKPTLYKNGLTSIDIPKIVVKSTMEVTPEIVGGNGKIYYKIRKGSETAYTGYGTSGAGIELMDGNDDYDNAAWTDASDHVKNGSLDTKTATITHNLDSNNPVRYQLLISANNAAWSLSYELYDSKEAGEVNKVYINIPEIDFAVYDEEAPSVDITPFYWNKDGDIKKSSAIYQDVEIEGETKTIARGHIDLKGELPDTFNGTSGVNDGDDKVSGIIKIEGTATDTRKLRALYISVPGMETYFGSGDGHANLTKKTVRTGNSSVDYYQIATYNGTSWIDKAGNLDDYGFAFQTSGNSLTDTGHTVNWTFTWDTSKISTITAVDVNIKVLAEDAASEASASDNNPQNKTTVGPLKVDVVPYITKLVTDISESAGEEFARSATGKYIVKGSYLDTDKITVKTETVKVYGFNLALTANSKDSSASIGSGTGSLSAGATDATGSYLNMEIGATTTSGKLAITVNDISSLNNVNQNPEFEAGAVSAKTDSKAMYNSLANNVTNNRLTDDVELVVWDMNYFLNETNITSSMMKMDKSGNYYMSYGEGVPSMYVNKNGTTRQVDYSYNKFHNTNVIYDDNGNIYAVATNTDRISDASARFTFYTPLIGETMPATIANNKPAYQYSTVTKRHLEQVYNGSTTVYDINRVMQPKLASYTKTDGTTYLGLVYYDYNNTINPVKVRFGTRASSYTAVSNTDYTFKYVNGGSYFYTSNNKQKLSGAVKIGNNYYALDCYGADSDDDWQYKISGYTGTTQFTSKIYTFGVGGLTGSTNGGTGQSNNPATTDSSASGYHIVASDSTTDFKGGQYAAVGIVPKKNGETVTGYVGVVAWYDAKASKVCYSYNESPENAVTGGAWQTNAKYIDTAKYSGWYVDLAVDDAGHIHIAYYNSAKGDLRYVYLNSYNADPSTPVTVDSFNSVGTNITVNVRKQGDYYVPYIYYYNASGNQTTSSIKVAWQKDTTLRNGAVGDKFTGAWECMTIPSANVPVDATVCGGVPTGTHTGTNVINYSKTVVLGYMTDKYYEKAYIKGDITSANW